MLNLFGYQSQNEIINKNILKKFKVQHSSDLFTVMNLQPIFSKKLQAFTLDFKRRATKASVKNTIFTLPNDKDDYIYIFGKIAKNKFTLDIKYPFNYLFGFAYSLSSLSHKLLIE